MAFLFIFSGFFIGLAIAAVVVPAIDWAIRGVCARCRPQPEYQQLTLF